MSLIRILLVDDDKGFLDIMGNKIANWGYEVVPVNSGKEAIEIINQKGADMVILDYRMPELDGVDTLTEIRKNDKDIPVFIFTSHPDNRALTGAEELGVSAFIPKYSVFSEAGAALKTAIEMAEKKLEKD